MQPMLKNSALNKVAPPPITVSHGPLLVYSLLLQLSEYIVHVFIFSHPLLRVSAWLGQGFWNFHGNNSKIKNYLVNLICPPTFLITKTKGCSKHSRGRNIWGLNKRECKHTSEQVGFANSVSTGALHRDRYSEKEHERVQ